MTEKVDIMESSSYYFISCIGDSVCKGTKLAWLRESEQKLETTLLVYTLFLCMVLLLLVLILCRFFKLYPQYLQHL